MSRVDHGKAIPAFVTYPPSAGFLAAIEASLGTPITCHVLADLRRHGLVGLVRHLRGLPCDRVVFPTEDRESEAVVPLLLVLGAMTRAHQFEAINATLGRTRLTRADAIKAAASLIGGTLDGMHAVWRADRTTRMLMRAHPLRCEGMTQGPVLYLNTNFWFGVKAGGSVGHIAGIVNGLNRLGWPVTYASITAPAAIDGGIPIARLAPPRVYGFPAEVNHYRFGQRALIETLDVAQRVRPKFIYQRLSVGNVTGVELSRRLRVPLVLEYNGSNVWVSKNWGRPLRFGRTAVRAEEACLRHAHRVMTVSKVSADELVDRGVPPERVVWYPNCVDERIFDPSRYTTAENDRLRRSIGLDPRDTVITFVGTFGPWHGAEVLAEAIGRMATNDARWLEESRVRVLFVGDGPRLARVREILDRHHATRFAVIRGLVPQAEAPHYLAASDILASPHVPNPDGTRFFGSPTKLFEYMAMGKAIIASDLDQVGEVLRPALPVAALPTAPPSAHGHRAVVVRPGSAEDLAHGLRFLVESKEWRLALGTAARHVVMEQYLWRHHVEHLLASLT